jgi:hypothetical protein
MRIHRNPKPERGRPLRWSALTLRVPMGRLPQLYATTNQAAGALRMLFIR